MFCNYSYLCSFILHLKLIIKCLPYVSAGRLPGRLDVAGPQLGSPLRSLDCSTVPVYEEL